MSPATDPSPDSSTNEEDSFYSAVESILGRSPFSAKVRNLHDGRVWVQPSGGLRSFGMKLVLDGNVRPPHEEIVIYRRAPEGSTVNAAFGTRKIRLVTTLELLYFAALLLEDRDPTPLVRVLELPDRQFIDTEEAMLEALFGSPEIRGKK
jgi:hypothetical protein